MVLCRELFSRVCALTKAVVVLHEDVYTLRIVFSKQLAVACCRVKGMLVGKGSLARALSFGMHIHVELS